jgi:hypothetical protein
VGPAYAGAGSRLAASVGACVVWHIHVAGGRAACGAYASPCAGPRPVVDAWAL